MVSPKDIHADMVATLEDGVPALFAVQKWSVEFKTGRETMTQGLDVLQEPPCSPHGDG